MLNPCKPVQNQAFYLLVKQKDLHFKQVKHLWLRLGEKLEKNSGNSKNFNKKNLRETLETFHMGQELNLKIKKKSH